ncbi:VanZ family protein [Actinoplanes sp. Pm04-4]|uniref:VanZ family protein n=1 Tax=Paractinoplanes pyxinae TaxID=2997416 RepID=A0ABT4B925_9ACTN|nr:VanZ family protein [Actinoplanes pyxinae]MCY1142375.1 VanZ family protein [Actinoplanes pyxinae]
MPSGQLDVPALPVLIPLGLVLMGVAALVLRRRGELRREKLIPLWLAGWYAVAVLGATMLPLRLAWGPEAGAPELYRILWIPYVTMRVDDFILNVLMLVPLAAALRVAFGVRDRKRVVLTGFLISLGIETTQLLMLLFLHGTRWADTNDLIANTLGAWLGWVLLQRVLRRRRQTELTVRS